MFKEYSKFIREYFSLARVKTSLLVWTIVSAVFYRGFMLLLPIFASWIVRYLMDDDQKMAYASLGALAVTYLLYNLSLFANYKIYGFNMSYTYNNLQTKILNKLASVDNNFTKFISKGRLMNSVNADVIDIGKMNEYISELTIGLLQISALFVIVAFFDIYITLILLVFAIIYIGIRNSADRKINIYHRKVVVQYDKYTTLLTQVISGLQEIKTFSMLPKLVGKLDSIQTKFTKHYLTKRYYWTIRDNDVYAINFVFRAILYVALIFLVMNGHIDVSVMVLVILYHENLVTYINWLIDTTASIRETNIAVHRIRDILNYDSSMMEYGSLGITDIYGSIEFGNVSLQIKDHEILKNINLKIDHNQVVAIVGEAGSGKTMMFNLMLRQIRPTRGTIKIDGMDIFDFSKEIYAKNVSVVSQKPFIFNMSIRKNLDFADRDIKRQIEACKKAGIHDFIMTLPNGYNTVLRENATNISGGQRQMISIARTLLSDAEILLLDDITTSLDPDTAKLVPKLVGGWKKDHTIIMITKKPDLMANADKIIVLDRGRIVASGTHAELMKTNEIYRVLQSRKSPSKIGVFDND